MSAQPKRIKKPTNITLDPRIKDAAERIAKDEAKSLSQLVSDMLRALAKERGVDLRPVEEISPSEEPAKPRRTRARR